MTCCSCARFDAFTHKSTSQHSLAFEKASIIFNISAVLSCYAAAQNRHEDTGLKTAYHSFQASAGMFTYINENFLHAPSTDLNHDTVRTLIALMLAQAQEVFLEKQIRDGKKNAMLAKLAMQAAFMHAQAIEGVQENVNQAVFEKVWLYLTEVQTSELHPPCSMSLNTSSSLKQTISTRKHSITKQQPITTLTNTEQPSHGSSWPKNRQKKRRGARTISPAPLPPTPTWARALERLWWEWQACG